MSSRRVMVLIGTRPEGIKMAPVIRLLEASRLDPHVVHTGQHAEMLDQVLTIFGVEPVRRLDVMRPNQTLAGLTSRLMTHIDDALESIQPSACLVQGDTTTVLCGALASFYRGVPVGHVEAGLRSFDLAAPFPEEANRVVASRLATYHYAPTERARDNLVREGVDAEAVLVTGNTVIDALHLEVERQRDPGVTAAIHAELRRWLPEAWSEAPFVLVTGHRRENFGAGFEAICGALDRLARTFEDVRFIYPVHLNPNVKDVVHARLGARANIHLLPPLAYSEFVALLARCRLVLTDSGGVQEEAPGLGKPVLVMREVTERPEGVEAGTVRLVGTDGEAIVEGVATLLRDADAYEAMAQAHNPYGDGRAAERIVRHLEGAFPSGGAA